MASPHRGPSADLEDDPTKNLRNNLLRKGRSYSFFQAVRLLRRLYSASTQTKDADTAKAIRIRPSLSLGFPSADIDTIDTISSEEQEYFRITATFLGLYGSSSPLPLFYTEDLLAEKNQDDENTSVSRDLLDTLHHQLYDLLFQGWLKYRQFLQVTEEKNETYLERLYCLLGLGSGQLRRDNSKDFHLLRYIGLVSQFPRSAMGLCTMLNDALPDVPLCIVPCITRKAKIPEPQRLKMGRSSHSLGVNAYVGEEIEDRMGKFRIQIGPLTQKKFLGFTPGNPDYDTLTRLTEFYFTEPLAYEMELILAAGEAQTVCLGDQVRSTLGVTTWVFSQKSLGEVRTRFSVPRN